MGDPIGAARTSRTTSSVNADVSPERKRGSSADPQFRGKNTQIDPSASKRAEGSRHSSLDAAANLRGGGDGNSESTSNKPPIRAERRNTNNGPRNEKLKEGRAFYASGGVSRASSKTNKPTAPAKPATSAGKNSDKNVALDQICAKQNIDANKAREFAKLYQPAAPNLEEVAEFADKTSRYQNVDVTSVAFIVIDQRTRKGVALNPMFAANYVVTAKKRDALRRKLKGLLPNTALDRSKKADPIKDVLTILDSNNRSSTDFVYFVAQNKDKLNRQPIGEIVNEFVKPQKSPLELLNEAKVQIWGSVGDAYLDRVVSKMALNVINETEVAVGATVEGFLKYLRDQKVTPASENSLFTAAQKYVEYMKNYDPLKDLSVRFAETLPKFKVKEEFLKEAIETIGKCYVNDPRKYINVVGFHKYIKAFQSYLNRGYLSEFLDTVAKEYVAYTKMRRVDIIDTNSWNHLLKKVLAHERAKDNELGEDTLRRERGMSISSTKAPQALEENETDRTKRELKDYIKGIYKQIVAYGVGKSLDADKFEAYVYQRIAVETDHLPNYNPFVPGWYLHAG